MQKRDIAIIAVALVLAVVLSIRLTMGQTIETGAWGLNFRTQGAAPMGPASSAQLAKYDAAYLGNTEDKVIYLTFDAGYENGCTAKILDVLKKHSVPAAFFLAGHYLESQPDLVRRMVEEGHTVGNHTMHHPDMSKIATLEAFQKELADLEALYSDIIGEKMPKFYRPPRGVYSEDNLKMAQSLGYKTVFWSLAYADWDNNAQPEPAAALEKLLGRTHDGAVVLLHSTSKTNAAILDDLLTQWESMGYRFAPISELFQ